MRDCAASFSQDYQEARVKFVAAASAAGGRLDAFEHPEQGPDGKQLFTDVACFGAKTAHSQLLVLSGTHGVEGFCGSGVQIELMRRGELAELPSDVGVVMVHAVNPYGFAWLRRVTHENIDLNRNWIDFEQELPRNEGYDALADALCPSSWNGVTQSESAKDIGKFVELHGQAAMVAAVTGGQYKHAKGLFFGGTQPSWSRETQSSILRDLFAETEDLAIIDIHTGLGSWGFGEQIASGGQTADGYDRARRWFGCAITSLADGTSASAQVAGDGLTAASEILPHARVTGIALEFGTVDPDSVLAALRGDAWLHGYGDPTTALYSDIKQRIRDAFYVDRDDWKGMVSGQALLAFRQAIRGLASEDGVSRN